MKLRRWRSEVATYGCSEVCPADKLWLLSMIAITFYEVKNFTWSGARNFTLQELHCGETTTSLDKDTLDYATRLLRSV